MTANDIIQLIHEHSVRHISCEVDSQEIGKHGLVILAYDDMSKEEFDILTQELSHKRIL